MTIEVYKVMHMLGLIMLFSGLCGLWGVYVSTKAPTKKMRVTLAVIHGIGMTLLLVSGFGQLARLGYTNGLPGWAIAKLTIWLALGVSMVLAKRKAHWGTGLLGLWILLGLCAACLAVFKPF